MTKDKGDIIDLVQGEENFQTIPEHNSVKDTREKAIKTCNIELKISMKILFHYPPTYPLI